MQSAMKSHGIELEQTPTLIELINAVIDVINTYIIQNKNKLKNNDVRQQNIMYLIRLIYNDGTACEVLSTKNLSSISPILIPHVKLMIIEKPDETFKRLNKMFQSMQTYVMGVETGRLHRSTLRDGLTPVLITNQQWINRFITVLQDKNKKTADENYLENIKKSPLYQLPKPIFDLILSFLDAKTCFKLCKISQLFNDTNKEAYWKKWIMEKFNFSISDILKLKNENETYHQFYCRVNAVNDMCMRIREMEREIEHIKLNNDDVEGMQHFSRANNIDSYKQTAESHKMDLLEGMGRKFEYMQAELDGLFEQRNRLQHPHNDSHAIIFMMGGFGRY